MLQVPETLAVSYPTQTRNSRTELVYDIPGLDPMPTTNVEGLPQIRPGQNIPLTNDEWFDWYDPVIDHRNRVWAETTADGRSRESYRSREISRVRRDERYWFYTYPAIFEARPDESDENIVFETEEEVEATHSSRAGMLPYVLYPFQDYWVTWQKQALRTRGGKGDTVTVKSRDMGMTNTGVGMITYRWMTRPVYQARVLSRNEDAVDASGDPDAIMWKMDLMLRSTPRWMLDAFHPGFDWNTHRRMMILEAPIGANSIKGESTNATAGRGKRASAILLDEFPFMQGLRHIWQATRPATYHRIALGSPSTLKGLDAYTLARSKAPAVIIMDSRRGMHPRQDSLWHIHERERSVFAGEYEQEVGIDWLADNSDFIYPQAFKKEVGDYPYVPFGGPTFCAIDDGKWWALWFLQYIRATGRIHVVDRYLQKGRRTDFYGALLRGRQLGDFHYGPEEQRILRLMHSMPIDYFMGDPHGANPEQIAGMSVLDHLASHWAIYVNIDYAKREHVDRQEALDALLPVMDFNDTPGVVEGLSNVQMYSLPATPPGKERGREPRTPLHNDGSHDPTALEFWAVQFADMKEFVGHGGSIVWTGPPNL